jgi:hypothetical protein
LVSGTNSADLLIMFSLDRWSVSPIFLASSANNLSEHTWTLVSASISLSYPSLKQLAKLPKMSHFAVYWSSLIYKE